MEQEKQNNNAIDLSKLLDNSDTKFQKEKQLSQYSFRPGTPKIIQWVIKYSGGLIKNNKQATYVLIGFIILAIIVLLFLIFGGKGGGKTFIPSAKAPAEEVIPPAEF